MASVQRMRRSFTLLLFYCLAMQVPFTAAGQDALLGAGVEPAAAVEAELGKHIEYLASDELRGRDVGSEGLELAAQYIAASFEQTGLETKLFNDTPFQTFKIPLGVTVGDPANNQLTITRAGTAPNRRRPRTPWKKHFGRWASAAVERRPAHWSSSATESPLPTSPSTSMQASIPPARW